MRVLVSNTPIQKPLLADIALAQLPRSGGHHGCGSIEHLYRSIRRSAEKVLLNKRPPCGISFDII